MLWSGFYWQLRAFFLAALSIALAVQPSLGVGNVIIILVAFSNIVVIVRRHVIVLGNFCLPKYLYLHPRERAGAEVTLDAEDSIVRLYSGARTVTVRCLRKRKDRDAWVSQLGEAISRATLEA